MNGRAVSLTYELPNTAKCLRLGTRKPLHKLLRSYEGSYSEVSANFLIFKETEVAHAWVIQRYKRRGKGTCHCDDNEI